MTITSGSEQITIKIADAPAPLKNIGNTCYLNAIMQILFMFNQVFNFGYWVSRNVDYSDVSNTNLQYYLIFQKFVYLSTLENVRKEHLNDFVSFLSSIDGFFEIGSQKDAHEAFLKILDIFDIGISAVLPGHNSITDTYFQGIYRNVKTCTICNKNSFSFEHFFHIRILPLINVKTALGNTFRETSFERYCEHCNSVNKHILSCTVYDHPRVLLVLVDRYTQSSSYSRSRRDCREIKMENILDLHGQRYKLSGIVKHLGTSVDSGHYIACGERNGSLYTCNDSVVHRIKNFPEQSCDVYLLFFLKYFGS